MLNPENPRATDFCDQNHLVLFHGAQSLMNWKPASLVLTTPASLTPEILKLFHGLPANVLIISAAAGVKLTALEKVLPNNPIIRIIPNIPVAVNAGTIGLTIGHKVVDPTPVRKLLDQLGNIIEVNEDQLNIVGTIGRCDPAFIDVIMDALGDAAVKHGLDRQKAYQLAASMITGSGKLALDTQLSPSALRDQVTSPGGTTMIRGVQALEKHGVRFALMDAVDQASEN